jgi:hypothetical protein
VFRRRIDYIADIVDERGIDDCRARLMNRALAVCADQGDDPGLIRVIETCRSGMTQVYVSLRGDGPLPAAASAVKDLAQARSEVTANVRREG